MGEHEDKQHKPDTPVTAYVFRERYQLFLRVLKRQGFTFSGWLRMQIEHTIEENKTHK